MRLDRFRNLDKVELPPNPREQVIARSPGRFRARHQVVWEPNIKGIRILDLLHLSVRELEQQRIDVGHELRNFPSANYWKHIGCFVQDVSQSNGCQWHASSLSYFVENQSDAGFAADTERRNIASLLLLGFV